MDIKRGHDLTHSSSHPLKSANNQDDQRPEHHSLLVFLFFRSINNGRQVCRLVDGPARRCQRSEQWLHQQQLYRYLYYLLG